MYFAKAIVLGIGTNMFFTIEREVAKDGSQQVHDKHGQNGDISNVLHAFLVWTEITRRQKKKKQIYQYNIFLKPM